MSESLSFLVACTVVQNVAGMPSTRKNVIRDVTSKMVDFFSGVNM